MHDEYINYFIDDHRRIPWIRRGKTGWKYIASNPIARNDVIHHLEQKHHVGVFRRESSYFLIDTDNKENPKPDEESLETRFHKISSSFPVSPTIIQSSSSKGLHLYYFLDKSYPVERIKEIITQRLNRNGIHLKPGQYELFPTFKSRGHRLPFGRGSYLLDYHLNPIHSKPIQGIDLFFHGLKSKIIPFDDLLREEEKWKSVIEEFHEIRKNKGTIYKDNTNNNNSTIIKNSTNNFSFSSSPSNKAPPFLHLNAEKLWEEGLRVPASRNESLLILINDGYWEGLDEQETYEKIEEWLYKKNNGLSKDWNERPDWVLQNLRYAIEKRYTFGGQRQVFLTRGNVRRIVLITGNISRKSKRFKRLQFLYDLLLYIKRVKDEHLYLSWKILTSFNGSSWRTCQENIQFCEEHQILEFVRNHSMDLRRAREYRCLFEFSRDTPPVRSLEQGLSQLLKPEEIRERYGRYYLGKILKALEREEEKEAA